VTRCLVLFAAFASGFALDPYKLLTRNYSLELENAYVRVSRVKYSGEPLPEHSHPSIPTVYVYLTDGGPIRFIHKTPKFELERKAGLTAEPKTVNSEVGQNKLPKWAKSSCQTQPARQNIRGGTISILRGAGQRTCVPVL
jgi:hypothetical protein